MKSLRDYALFATALITWDAVGAMAQTTNALSDMEIRGRQLAHQLLEQRPTENFTNTGVLQIRNGDGNRTNVSVSCEVRVGPTNWTSIYTSSAMDSWEERLVVIHSDNLTNRYLHYLSGVVSSIPLPTADASPFANSDFWICDLGLEFLHWPGQKILRGETMRGVFCRVLESTNRNPPTNGYSRVVTWIDNESLGIVQAKAYDAKGNLLKDFYPNDVKKVNGQWQVGSMEIYSVQTRSRTTLKFDLKPK